LAPAPTSKRFLAPGQERFGPLKTEKHCIICTIGSKNCVKQELKFQAQTPAPPFKFLCLQLQASTIAWAPAPAPQPWLKDSIYCG